MAEENSDFFEESCGYFENLTKKEEILYVLPEDVCINSFEEVNGYFKCPPGFTAQETLYGELLANGWRRSGYIFYRETCPHCKKCLGIRLPVDKFEASKSQRKSVRKNLDIEITLTSDPKDFVTDEKIQLFKMYDKRHNPTSENPDGNSEENLKWMNGVNGDCEKDYSGTFNMDYRLNGKLIAVGVVDRAENSLSSNYFYYDISDEILKRSIGVFSVIQEIEACKGNLFDGALKSDFYYLGYFIADCDKMNYKIQYKPNELFIDGEWKLQREKEL